jgi:hypothetical protein
MWKVVQANAGLITEFEVLQLLRQRGLRTAEEEEAAAAAAAAAAEDGDADAAGDAGGGAGAAPEPLYPQINEPFPVEHQARCVRCARAANPRRGVLTPALALTRRRAHRAAGVRAPVAQPRREPGGREARALHPASHGACALACASLRLRWRCHLSRLTLRPAPAGVHRADARGGAAAVRVQAEQQRGGARNRGALRRAPLARRGGAAPPNLPRNAVTRRDNTCGTVYVYGWSASSSHARRCRFVAHASGVSSSGRVFHCGERLPSAGSTVSTQRGAKAASSAEVAAA